MGSLVALVDIRTLFLAATVANICAGLLQSFLGMMQRGEAAMLYWGISNLLSALGFALLAVRGLVPDVLSIAVANGLLLLSTQFMGMGLRCFAGQPLSWSWLLLPPLAVTLALAWLPVFESLPARVALHGLLLVVLLGIQLRDNWKAQRAEFLVLRGVVIACLAFLVALNLVRGVGALAGAFPTYRDLMQGDGFQSLFVVLSFMAFLLLLVALMLMASERLQNRLRRAAMADALTGVLNRAGLAGRAARVLRRRQREAVPATLLMMDLDRFKHINDTYGHEVGDRLLCAFVQTAREVLRPEDLLSRHGGEEFVALLPGRTAAAAQAVAERIRLRFAESPVPVDGQRIGTTVCIGVAELTATGATLDDALARADRALYAAKRAGRDRVVVAVPA